MIDSLNEYLSYNPDTGILRWKKCTAMWMKPGSVAGNVQHSGREKHYVRVHFLGSKWYAHRLIYMIMTGKNIPEGMVIDHLDGNGLNNRWNNIRLTTQAVNAANIRNKRLNVSGQTGVHMRSDGKKWVASAHVNGRTIYLGSFDTVDAAVEARRGYLTCLKEVRASQ